MDVNVTSLASFGRALKLRVSGTGWSFVTGTAGSGAMRSNQWKFCFRMIELFDIGPGLHAMTSLAAELRTAGTALLHALVELAMMRIGMASRATPVFEMEWQYLVGTPVRARFVATHARNHSVRAFQSESRVAVHGDSKFRAVKTIDGMTGLAAILEILGELSVVSIVMAIKALSKLHLIDGVHTGRDMALAAVDSGVFPKQWIIRSCVFFYAKERRLPAKNVVTFFAFPSGAPGHKLVLVRIGLMTVCTILKSKRFAEITPQMALGAIHFFV
jgi:hypothetical protein